MSSDMFVFDELYYSNLATHMIFPEELSGNFLTDQTAPSDSSIESILQEFSDNQNNKKSNFTNTTQFSSDEAQSFDQITHTFFSNSPPSYQLETLSLHQQQQTNIGSLGNVFNNNDDPVKSHKSEVSLGNVFTDNYTVVSETVKSEDFQLGIEFTYPSYSSFLLGSNNCSSDNYGGGGGESMLKFMQRSLSSNSFEGKASVWFQPKFDALMEFQGFKPDFEGSFCNGQIRRVCSTGDITKVGRVCSSASPLSGGTGEGNNMVESNFKIGKYSAEERKERIDRYKAKRTQRNFNKTIKYACRKTLADNRPRIRGRFARNDETGEIPKPTCFNRYKDDDELWVDNLQEEDEEGILGKGGRFLSNFGPTHHFQYCGY